MKLFRSKCLGCLIRNCLELWSLLHLLVLVKVKVLVEGLLMVLALASDLNANGGDVCKLLWVKELEKAWKLVLG